MLAVYGKKESKKNGIVAGNNVFSGIFVKQILCVPKEQLLLGIACFNKKSSFPNNSIFCLTGNQTNWKGRQLTSYFLPVINMRGKISLALKNV